MKFLFIVQGEGRGHFTQAITLEAMLLRNGHQVGSCRQKFVTYLARLFQPEYPGTGKAFHQSEFFAYSRK